MSQFQCGGPVLSEPLPITGLVGRRPANHLMGRVPILRRVAPLPPRRCRPGGPWNISASFPAFCSSAGQVAHVLRTRSPLVIVALLPHVTVRLACIRPAASVHPEPGSNSPLYLVSSFFLSVPDFLRYSSQKYSPGMSAADLHPYQRTLPSARSRASFGNAKVALSETRNTLSAKKISPERESLRDRALHVFREAKWRRIGRKGRAAGRPGGRKVEGFRGKTG